MKHLKLFTIIAIGAIASLSQSSCTRKYVCHCDIKYNGAPGMPKNVVREYDIQDTKDNAKSACEGETKAFNNNNINSLDSCYLY